MQETFTKYISVSGKILKIIGDSSSILEVSFETSIGESSINTCDVIISAAHQLTEYLRGERKEFNLPLTPKGTDFQKSVWRLLQEIPFGKTRTYGQIAQQLGDPKVIRAAASANGKNPIAIIIPCHRVIGSDGSLTGYAGGLENKRFLLDLEQANGVLSLF